MTDYHQYQTPTRGTTDWHTPLNENFAAIDADIEIRDADTNRTDYEPKANAKFLATDTRDVYLGDGTQWDYYGKFLDTDAGEVIVPQWTFDDGIQVGQNPADTITETTTPTGFGVSAGDDRDIHVQTDVALSNSSGGAATEDITVELYDGTDTTGTLVDSETRAVEVSSGGSTTETFLATPHLLDTGDYFVSVTQSGSTLTIDQTDEHTKGSAHALGEKGDGTVHLQNQDGVDVLTVDPRNGLPRLPPRSSPPTDPQPGATALADGANWDPDGDGNAETVIYNGTAWVEDTDLGTPL